MGLGEVKEKRMKIGEGGITLQWTWIPCEEVNIDLHAKYFVTLVSASFGVNLWELLEKMRCKQQPEGDAHSY